MSWGQGIGDAMVDLVKVFLFGIFLLFIGIILGGVIYHYRSVAGCEEARAELEKCRASLNAAQEEP